MPDLNSAILESSKDADFELDIRVTALDKQAADKPVANVIPDSFWSITCGSCASFFC